MDVSDKKSQLWSAWTMLALAAGSMTLSGCRNQNADEPDDRSGRQQLEDEYAGCPPLLPLDPSKGGWELAPGAKYRALGSGDLIIVRANGKGDVTYDITLATTKLDAPPVAAGPTTKPVVRKPSAAPASSVPVVYLYRRPPESRLSGVPSDFHICGHLRTTSPAGFVSVHDADGIHSIAVEPMDAPK